MVQVAPLPRRDAALRATDFVSSLFGVGNLTDVQIKQKAFFTALVNAAVPEKDLAAYKAALAKLNALKDGEKPEGKDGALSDVLFAGFKIRDKCIEALKPFMTCLPVNPDSALDVNALSTESFAQDKSYGRFVEKVISDSGLSRKELGEAFKTPVDFDKFVEAQMSADSSLDYKIADDLWRKFYPDSYDPRL